MKRMTLAPISLTLAPQFICCKNCILLCFAKVMPCAAPSMQVSHIKHNTLYLITKERKLSIHSHG